MFDQLLAALVAAVVSAAPAPLPDRLDVPTAPVSAAVELPLLPPTDPNDTVPERPVETFPVTTAAPDDWCIPIETDPSRGQRHWSFFDCVPTADDVARWRSGQ